MYIIKTISKNKKDSEQKYYSYRMMESVRVGKKVRKITLLNLGSDFSVEQKDWAVLSSRVDDILNQTPRLFDIDKELEKKAQRYAKLIIASKAKVKEQERNVEENEIKEEDKYKEIEISTIKQSDNKSIGVESVVYESIKELGLKSKLKELGFTNIQLNSAIGTIVSKITNPSSDIGSYNWLCKTSGVNELMGCDFNKISSSNIYRVADKLNDNKEEIEEYLYNTQKEIFQYDETITLYDLTNTYFEGSAKGVKGAKRGRSKEKRSDAPLVTLAVMLDSSGFVRKSEIFDGNVGEATTFKEMILPSIIKHNQNYHLN